VSLMPSRVRHRACEGAISSRARLLAAIEWGVRHVCLRDLRRDVPDVEARSLETIRTLRRAAAANAVAQRHDLQIYLLSRYQINICVRFGVAEILLDGATW